MDKIASFKVDHTKLMPGLYVSRVDKERGVTVTTFDIRMKRPNKGDYLTTTAAHTIEHLGATFLRNDERTSESTVYFGPMGCRTGFYAVFFGELEPEDVGDIIADMFQFIIDFEGTVPGQSEVECGNYQDLDLEQAKMEAIKFLPVITNLTEENTVYAE